MSTFEKIENTRLHEKNHELWDKVDSLERHRLVWASIAIGAILFNVINAIWSVT